jgi:hypothetical protein
VNLWSLIDCYTSQAAMACLQEELAGTLEAGKRADLTVLDRDLFGLPAGEIHRARVLLTLVEGKAVFRDRAL